MGGLHGCSQNCLCCFCAVKDHSHHTDSPLKGIYIPPFKNHFASFVFQDEFLHRQVFLKITYQLDILKMTWNVFLNVFRKPVYFVVLAKKCPICHWIHLALVIFFSHTMNELLNKCNLDWLSDMDFRWRMLKARALSQYLIFPFFKNRCYIYICLFKLSYFISSLLVWQNHV